MTGFTRVGGRNASPQLLRFFRHNPGGLQLHPLARRVSVRNQCARLRTIDQVRFSLRCSQTILDLYRPKRVRGSANIRGLTCPIQSISAFGSAIFPGRRCCRTPFAVLQQFPFSEQRPGVSLFCRASGFVGRSNGVGAPLSRRDGSRAGYADCRRIDS